MKPIPRDYRHDKHWPKAPKVLTDQRLVRLLEDVFATATGKRLATRTAQRLAEEILADGYERKPVDE